MEKILSKEGIEICADNFAHEYLLHYECNNWHDIVNYDEYIPKIIRNVVKDNFNGDFETFKEIMNEIDGLKTKKLKQKNVLNLLSNKK